MPDARRPFLVTLRSRDVGIAMPVQAGFAFVATDPDFDLLDGSSFRRLEQLEAAAHTMARVVRGRERSELTVVPIPRPSMFAGVAGPWSRTGRAVNFDKTGRQHGKTRLTLPAGLLKTNVGGWQ
jgi:hypothetical protein